MTNEQRAIKLKAAASLIFQVRDSFSNEKKTCECCGMHTFVAWNEHQMRDNLNGAISRLQKVTDRMFRVCPDEPVPEPMDNTGN